MFGILALAMLAGNGVQAQQAGIGAQAQQKDLVGNWQGTLQAGNGLRLVMKVKKDDGKLRAVSYSIDQGGAQIAITSISLDGNAVSFSIEPLDVTYAGTMSADGKTFLFRGLGDLMVTNSTMKDFCEGMQGAVMDKPVVDHTGLTERYDFALKWTPDESQFAQMGARIPPPSDDPNTPPSLYAALQEQLGLKLEPTKASADVLVIDHVEKPSAN
jgi:uncharacterized protein (TIGR03435 family)